MLVIEGPKGNGVGRELALKYGHEFIKSVCRKFPDGESEVEIGGDASGKDAVIVQSTFPNQDESLMQLFFLANELKKQKAKRVGAVVPYIAYARQDKKLQEKNVVVSIEAVLELMNASGISFLVTVAPHNPNSFKAFSGDVKFADWITPMVREVSSTLADPLVLAPDKGAAETARKFSERLSCGYSHIDKERDRVTGETRIAKAPADNFTGRDVLIVDDMIATGGSIAQASKFALSGGAKRVVVAAAHLLMVGGAMEKLKEAGVAEVYGTNSVLYDRARIIDLSKEINDALVSVVHD